MPASISTRRRLSLTGKESPETDRRQSHATASATDTERPRPIHRDQSAAANPRQAIAANRLETGQARQIGQAVYASHKPQQLGRY